MDKQEAKQYLTDITTALFKYNHLLSLSLEEGNRALPSEDERTEILQGRIDQLDKIDDNNTETIAKLVVAEAIIASKLIRKTISDGIIPALLAGMRHDFNEVELAVIDFGKFREYWCKKLIYFTEKYGETGEEEDMTRQLKISMNNEIIDINKTVKMVRKAKRRLN